MAVSPNGRLVSYRAAGPVFRIAILDLATGQERFLPSPERAPAQVGAVFSPDGRSVAYLRWVADNTVSLVVAPTDGSGTGVELGPRTAGRDGNGINNYGVTPDGTAVIGNYGDNLTRRLPVDGSPGTELSAGDMAFAAYQRLAP